VTAGAVVVTINDLYAAGTVQEPDQATAHDVDEAANISS